MCLKNELVAMESNDSDDAAESSAHPASFNSSVSGKRPSNFKVKRSLSPLFQAVVCECECVCMCVCVCGSVCV